MFDIEEVMITDVLGPANTRVGGDWAMLIPSVAF